jgi:plastocyanin
MSDSPPEFLAAAPRFAWRVFMVPAAFGLVTACNADTTQPPPGRGTDLVIQKPDSNSGDRQVGVAGRPLPQDFHALVTRNGKPAPGVAVYWTTFQGTMNPPVDTTDAEGISASRWTTEYLYEEQEAYASLDSVTGTRGTGTILPDMIQYTAKPYPDPVAANTVHVVTDSAGNRFEPADITVSLGDTVNWLWDPGSTDHAVTPDDGDLPPTSGPPSDYPHFLSFRFTTPGTYHYHCPVHGASGGVGMAGTVTVLPLR